MDCSRINSHGRSITEEHEHQDRLSQLPDALLILVLSRLEMEEAVKTGILSKRWKDLWTQVDNIVFEYDANTDCFQRHLTYKQIVEEKSLKLHRFVSFVDHTLMRCTGLKIKSFYLDLVNDALFHYDESFETKFYTWIDFVLERKVEFMTLRFVEDFDFIPACLYRSSTLTKLVLDVVQVDALHPVSWTSLKTLYLMNMMIDDQSIANILEGCPVLETMVLHAVCGVHHINISSPSVRKLELFDFHEYDETIDNILKITAPGIQKLKIVGRFVITKCQLVDVSSLVKATLNFTTIYSQTNGLNEESTLRYKEFTREWIRMVAELLQSVSRVYELIIGTQLIQVLSLSKLLGRPSPWFRKCKHVWITSPLWRFDMPGIISLLENGPHLETLFIKVVQLEIGMPLTQVMEFFENGNPHILYNSHWKFLHLKTIKIDYPQENMYTECIDVAIIRHILTRAAVLEKLVLCSSSGTGSNFCRQQMLKFSELLSTLLTQNKVAEWVLTEMNGTFKFSFLRSI